MSLPVLVESALNLHDPDDRPDDREEDPESGDTRDRLLLALSREDVTDLGTWPANGVTELGAPQCWSAVTIAHWLRPAADGVPSDGS